MNNKGNLDKRGIELEETLDKFINNKFNAENLSARYPNTLLRDDIFSLLEMFCTVIYYPLDEETKNHGFNIKNMPLRNGNVEHFVFINTAQTMEKQVFTAAHELGHIWDVDKFTIENLNLPDDQQTREDVINRFAAVLLMPKKTFLSSFNIALKNVHAENEMSKDGNIIIKLIVNLMYIFHVPYKAIVYRFYELGFINDDALSVLLNKNHEPSEEINELLNHYINKFGYSSRFKASKRKWIKDLPELLATANRNHLATHDKIKHVRDFFDISPDVYPRNIDNDVKLMAKKGTQKNES